MINNEVGSLVSLTVLTSVTTILTTLLIPIAIFLHNSTQQDIVDTATIQNKIINLKYLVISLCTMCVVYFLWIFANIRLLLILAYLAAICVMLLMIVKSVKWMADWDSNLIYKSSPGFRVQQRDKLLVNSKLTEDQRMFIWNSRLQNNIKQKSFKSLGTDNDQNFIDLFKETYKEFTGYNRVMMIQNTFTYFKQFYKDTDSYNMNFFSYSIQKACESISQIHPKSERESDPQKDPSWELMAWKTTVSEECRLLIKRDSTAWIVLYTINEQTHYAKSFFAKKFLAECIIEFLCNSNLKYRSEVGKEWMVNYNKLKSATNKDTTEWAIFETFVTRVRQQEVADSNIDQPKTELQKSYNIFDDIFKKADAAMFRQLELLFFFDMGGIECEEVDSIGEFLLTKQHIYTIQKTLIFSGC